MALLRRLEKLVGGKVLATPNRLQLNTVLPVKLCTEPDPCLGHVYPLPNLFWHIQQLEEHSEVRKESWLHKSINRDLDYLLQMKNFHISNAIRYVQGGAELTAQAIADLYSVKKEIRATDDWFDKFVNPWVQEKLPYMSVQNIYTVLSALKGSESPIVVQLVSELGKRDTKDNDLVDYDCYESTVYRYADRPAQWNSLLDACSGHHNRLKFEFSVFSQYISDLVGSVLLKTGSSYSNFRLSHRKAISRDDIKKLLGEFTWNNQAQALLEKL